MDSVHLIVIITKLWEVWGKKKIKLVCTKHPSYNFTDKMIKIQNCVNVTVKYALIKPDTSAHLYNVYMSIDILNIKIYKY